MKQGILFFLAVLLLVDLFLFAAIYQSLEDDWFVQNDPDRSHITFGEAIWASINFQSLLGSGSINPRSDSARAWASIQTLLTFLTIVVVIGSKTLSAID